MTETEKNFSGVDGSESTAPAFEAIDRTQSSPAIQLPDELWLTVLESPCTFPPNLFAGVMLNLIKNPNITSTHLFRADILHDSEKDMFTKNSLSSHLKAEYRPLSYHIPGFTLTRTIVRQMVPRNPQLDKPLVQTCHFFSKDDDDGEENVVVYLPHVKTPAELPFYHPTVARLAFMHRWPSATSTQSTIGSISISYSLFPSTTIDNKLSRTALRLLQTVHKHGQGQLRGYEKRVNLDRVIPQKRYQDTYARLKAKYGRLLSEQWVEVTDPGKHVFEDIGIAAYLIELWKDMYTAPANSHATHDNDSTTDKPPFPCFVDIGCGNGILTSILLAEGYPGWGFDARERKTWSIFPPQHRAQLQRRILIPSVFLHQAQPAPQTRSNQDADDDAAAAAPLWHTGIFAPHTFIISNHADELTAWTPLLAYLNDASFIAIPCCSHDLGGSRFRAPATTKSGKATAEARLPQQQVASGAPKTGGQAAETGSLKRTEGQKKMPSAYATLCSYVGSLAAEVGFAGETTMLQEDVLRIPSTRNRCIVGRRDPHAGEADRSLRDKEAMVAELVEREVGRDVQAVGLDWIERAKKLAKKPGSGH